MQGAGQVQGLEKLKSSLIKAYKEVGLNNLSFPQRT
jgi:hypothetical protein